MWQKVRAAVSLWPIKGHVKNFNHHFPPFACLLVISGLSEPRGLGGTSPPVFGRFVNPISTRGTGYANHIIKCPPSGFSDLHTALHVHWHTLMLFVKFQSGNWATHHFLNGHNDKPTKIGHNFRLMIFESLFYQLISREFLHSSTIR